MNPCTEYRGFANSVDLVTAAEDMFDVLFQIKGP